MTARGQMSPMQYGLSGPHSAPGRAESARADRAGQPPADDGELYPHLPVETNTWTWTRGEGRLVCRRASPPTSHENDFKAMQFFIDRSVDILKAAGAPSLGRWSNDSKGGAHSGTAVWAMTPSHRW
jgi:hypothetical protein